MITLQEAKEWLSIDEDDDGRDSVISSLLDASISDIFESTGISSDYEDNISDERNKKEITSLYNMCQRVYISNEFYERDTANKALLIKYTKLELAYRQVLKRENRKI